MLKSPPKFVCRRGEAPLVPPYRCPGLKKAILREKEVAHNATRKMAKPSQLADSRRDNLVDDGDVSETVSVDELFNRIIAAAETPEKRATLENMTNEQRWEYVALIESDPDGEGFVDQKIGTVRERSRKPTR